jgi:hypothetical protein
MKKIAAAAALFAALAPSLARAGGLYGRISDGSGPLRSQPLEVIASGQHYPTQTDKEGAYTLYVPVNGTCQFVVKYRGEAISTEINSYDSSVRYDFTIVKKNGRYTLQKQ